MHHDKVCVCGCIEGRGVGGEKNEKDFKDLIHIYLCLMQMLYLFQPGQ